MEFEFYLILNKIQMAYLFSAIIDELKNNDIEQINSTNIISNSNCNLILRFDSIYNSIRIYNWIKWKESIIDCTYIKFYKIPLELSFEKIIYIIWFILVNDYANKINLNQNCLSNNYIRITQNLYEFYVYRTSIKTNELHLVKPSITFFDSNSFDISTDAKFIKFKIKLSHNFDILYKLQ